MCIRDSARAGDRRVIVFATQATLSLERYRAAQRKYCPDAVALPAPELVLMVERGVVSGAEPEAYFRRALAPFPARQIGAIVLGCTHFVFLKGALLNVAPGAAVFDGCEAACEKLRSALAAAGLLASDGLGSVQLLSSSPDERVLARMQALLSEG